MEMRLIKHKYGLEFGCAACLMPIHAEASPVAREDDLPRGPQQAVRTGSKFQVVCGSGSREPVRVSRAGVLENSRWAAASASTVSAMLGTGLVRVVSRYLIVQARSTGAGMFCPIDTAYQQLFIIDLSIRGMHLRGAMQLSVISYGP